MYFDFEIKNDFIRLVFVAFFSNAFSLQGKLSSLLTQRQDINARIRSSLALFMAFSKSFGVFLIVLQIKSKCSKIILYGVSGDV